MIVQLRKHDVRANMAHTILFSLCLMARNISIHNSAQLLGYPDQSGEKQGGGERREGSQIKFNAAVCSS